MKISFFKNQIAVLEFTQNSNFWSSYRIYFLEIDIH